MALSAHNPGLSYRAKVTGVEDAASDIRIIRLRPAEPFSYKAGQYIHISFNGLETRPYSIASAPGSNEIEVHIKRGKGPASTYALEKLVTGEEVRFTGPGGQSWYDENSRAPVVAIAGGLGIAPIKAITEQAMAAKTPPSFTLYWGTFTAEERYLEEFFQRMAHNDAFQYYPVTGDHVGDIALKNIPDFADYQVYVSGPPAMISDLVPRLIAQGAKKDRIRFDNHPEAARTSV